MSNPDVRQIGSVQDADGRWLPVGVDYDLVTIGEHRFTGSQVEGLAQLLVRATWEAARCEVPDD